MREGFLLDPDVTHLNHGSFGACPVSVFEEYQLLQLELERGPTDFFTRRVARWFSGGKERPGRLAEARAALAGLVGARVDDLVFVPNATSGLNAVIRSLSPAPGDEVLGSRGLRGLLSSVPRRVERNRLGPLHGRLEDRPLVDGQHRRAGTGSLNLDPHFMAAPTHPFRSTVRV